MKILRRKKYNELVNFNKGIENNYQTSIKNLTKETEYYENKINEIDDRLVDVLNSINTSTSKQSIKQKINDVIRYIRKGE